MIASFVPLFLFSYLSTAQVSNIKMAISFDVFAVPDSVVHPKKFTIFGWGLSPMVLPSSISRERHSLCVSAVFPTEERGTCYDLPTVPFCLLFVCLYLLRNMAVWLNSNGTHRNSWAVARATSPIRDLK